MSSTVIELVDAFCLLPTDAGAVPALRGMNLTVHAGERVVVHGPNGSGKTTMLRVLVGDAVLAAGSATVAGRRVGDVGDADASVAAWRAKNLGWVDQHAGRTLRPELHVLDNVALQMRLLGSSRRAARAAARVALDRLTVGHLAERQVHDLSGGEAQRVAVAAAIVHAPSVVFADEPAGQLDRDAADGVYAALADAAGSIGAALVLVSHDLRAAAVADRIVRVRDGRLTEASWPKGAGPNGLDAGREVLLVDPRGWLRLPEPFRRTTGIHDTVIVTASATDGTLQLRPPAALETTADHEPSTSASSGSMWPAPTLSMLAGTDRHDLPGAPTSGAGRHTTAGAGRADVTKQAEAGRIVARCVAASRDFTGRTVLAATSLAVETGHIVVVQGPSGSGKSTLLRLLAGLDRPTSGTAEIGGVDLSSLDRTGLANLRRAQVGMVLQDINLSETATLAENLELARVLRGLPPDAVADAELLGLLGIGHLAQRHARSCSGGERQRAALARALTGQPSLLVLDEPTSQLDEASTERIAHVLRGAADSGSAVIIATHDPAVLAIANTILHLG